MLKPISFIGGDFAIKINFNKEGYNCSDCFKFSLIDQAVCISIEANEALAPVNAAQNFIG